MGTLTVGQLSEAELLKVINAELSKAQGSVDSFDVLVGSGDDCAVLATSDGRYCVSTDVLVQGHHFRTSWSSAEQIGARAAAQNLADIAAMGARQRRRSGLSYACYDAATLARRIHPRTRAHLRPSRSPSSRRRPIRRAKHLRKRMRPRRFRRTRPRATHRRQTRRRTSTRR